MGGGVDGGVDGGIPGPPEPSRSRSRSNTRSRVPDPVYLSAIADTTEGAEHETEEADNEDRRSSEDSADGPSLHDHDHGTPAGSGDSGSVGSGGHGHGDVPVRPDGDRGAARRKRRRASAGTGTGDPVVEERFGRFWQVWPKDRRVGKPEAFAEFQKLNPDEVELAVILAGVLRWKASRDWVDAKFIPHPVRFLRKKRWNDPDSGPAPALKTRNDAILEKNKATFEARHGDGGTRVDFAGMLGTPVEDDDPWSAVPDCPKALGPGDDEGGDDEGE